MQEEAYEGKERGQHPEVLAGTGTWSRRASTEDLDSLDALAMQTLPSIAKPCAGKNTHSRCFNYMESNNAGMPGTVSLLKGVLGAFGSQLPNSKSPVSLLTVV